VPFRLQLRKQTLESQDEGIRTVLTGVKRSAGMIPNMYAYMANAPEALETYLAGYERFRRLSGFTPAEQEVVFLTISYENECDYCMAAHSVIADAKSMVPKDVTNAIRAGAAIPDAKLAALARFTRVMLLKRGRPSEADAEEFLGAGYSEKQMLDIILALAVKMLSNYSNHLFATEVDDAFKSRTWEPVVRS
ncbi:MAG: carboxymuconolactone decarboxylase family protein, partial [bacterium]|nr:carboxymuconolactone decarboxylase family protein [bacterium]